MTMRRRSEDRSSKEFLDVLFSLLVRKPPQRRSNTARQLGRDASCLKHYLNTIPSSSPPSKAKTAAAKTSPLPVLFRGLPYKFPSLYNSRYASHPDALPVGRSHQCELSERETVFTDRLASEKPKGSRFGRMLLNYILNVMLMISECSKKHFCINGLLGQPA